MFLGYKYNLILPEAVVVQICFFRLVSCQRRKVSGRVVKAGDVRGDRVHLAAVPIPGQCHISILLSKSRLKGKF
jgi:hypothetical protein